MTVIQQAVRLKLKFPNQRQPAIRRGRLAWSVKLQPTPMSVTYTAHLSYEHRRRPRVTIVSPELPTRPGEPLPHVYEGNELCLYYGNEFNGSDDYIAETIVPWTSEWLMYYEMWFTTGDWLSSEVTHDMDTVKD